MELLKSPFLNDPSAIVAQAFEIEYPGKVFEAILVEKIEDATGIEMIGCTTYPDDGGIPLIEVDANIPAGAVPEILAHELAHVAVLENDHGTEWKAAFEKIYSKYNELAFERFGNQNTEELEIDLEYKEGEYK